LACHLLDPTEVLQVIFDGPFEVSLQALPMVMGRSSQVEPNFVIPLVVEYFADEFRHELVHDDGGM
jgi:hypothetical protein